MASLHVSLTISPVRDQTGQVVGASKIARDISDRKRDEKRIYDLMTQLKEADLRKNEFLAILAHELHNPLTPLLNALEIMNREQGNGAVLEQIRPMLARQLGQMAAPRRRPDRYRPCHGRQARASGRRVELASILHRSLEGCRPLAESAGHEVSVSLPPGAGLPARRSGAADPGVRESAEQRLQVHGAAWPNLGDRGIQARDRGEVKDTGLDIAADKLDSIFELFTQLGRSREHSQGGLGIGLALVKQLVEMHGGSVQPPVPARAWAASLLPCPSSSKKRRRKLRKQFVGRFRARRRRVLVVDDNEDAAQSLAALLNVTGHETRLAHDGVMAVEIAAGFFPPRCRAARHWFAEVERPRGLPPHP